MSVLGALSDLPIDDPRIYVEFTAIKDTVLEMSKVSQVVPSLSSGQCLLNSIIGQILGSFHNGPRSTLASDCSGICEPGVPTNLWH